MMLVINKLALARRRGYYFQNLSLEIKPGELLAVFGARNSGKTQLVEALVGARAAAAGEIRLFGEPIKGGLPQPLNRVGYAPQNLGLWPDLTAGEILGFYCGYRQEWVKNLQKHWSLEAVIHTRVSDLEGPLRQRLNLAVSETGDPPLFVWDEPYMAADVETMALIRNNIERLLAREKMIVLTTAFYHELKGLPAERVLVLKGNRAQVMTRADLLQEGNLL